jgi:hypothetical protein
VLVFALAIGFIVLPMGTSGGAMPGGRDRRALAPNAQAASAAPSEATTAAAFGKVEMSFEPNHGQTDEQVKFLARGAGYTVFLTATEAVFVLAPQGDAQAKVGNAVPANSSSNAITTWTTPPAVLRMKLGGANLMSEAVGQQKLEGIVNYFKGSDPAKWHPNIPTFARVEYSEIYPGIDLVYYGNQRQLEYDFVVRPGADYGQVSLAFEGADGMELDGVSGDLLLKVSESTIRQRKPVVYQEVDGQRREVESSYELRGAGRVGFAVGHYDATKPLIIDPVLAYSTYLGGGAADGGNGIAVDASGNAYVTGLTQSVDFPTTTNPVQPDQPFGDAFVTKLNAAGSALIYSTYFGGGGGDGGSDIAIDASGNAYVTGSTSSIDFPTTSGAFDTNLGIQDGFMTKLNATGSVLAYSTYLGGSADDSGYEIAVDPTGNAYILGLTNSGDFPATPGAFDTTANPGRDFFVAKLNASGSALVYSTYLGGGANDFGGHIAIDASGNVYVTGTTSSIDFPTTPGALDTTDNPGDDAFVTKLNVTGTALVYSTYLGGNSTERGGGITVDSAGNAYVTGLTDSNDFPIQNAFQTDQPLADGFVSKLNPTGSALVYSTYLGGSEDDSGGSGIAVDAAGNAYVAGDTVSPDFPTANPFQSYKSSFDVFVTKLDAAGSALVYSTYLGGGGNDFANGIAIDSLGNAYIVGSTTSADFPTSGNAFQTSKSLGSDVFISKIGDYTISGRVVDSGGNGIADVTITLSGSNSDFRTTDANGDFLFLDTVAAGSYSVTPAKEGFTFNPASFGIGSLNSNVSAILFTGSPAATPTPTPPTTFQFSATSFAANEGDGRFQLIVTRSGDNSLPQSIDYATTDGTANDRGDYATAIGRLRFPPGATAQSFDIFITDDVLAEGNETVLVTLSGSQIGGTLTALLTIVDNDLVNGSTNPIDATAFFVRQHYVDFLGREPDPAGLAFWINNIDSCGANAGCREVRRTDTSAAFFLSIEFQETGFLVHRAVRAAFNRLPRYREFIRDSHELGRNVVVGQSGYAAQLEINKQAQFERYVARSEFTAIYDGLTNEQYVDALNANTGNSLSASERNALVAGLNASTETRATVLRKVSEDPDFRAREFTPAFVLMEYIGYLRRNPNDSPDADFSGYDFWFQKLNLFAGDYRQAEMVKAFISSIEYRQRFGP